MRECDIIFLTVPDGSIRNVWEDIRGCGVEGKIICHCSGALTSREAFPAIEEKGAFGYSVHPLFAVSDKFKAYRELTDVFFAVEGSEEKLSEVMSLIASAGNPVKKIEASKKTLYHCAAATASNLVCGLADQSLELMERCGFSREEALAALSPILIGNMEHTARRGPRDSLTGPVERNDVSTVEKHLDCLENKEERQLYILLSLRLVKLARERHPDRNYAGMEEALRKDEEK